MAVLAALPDKYSWRMRIDFARMMNVVVVDAIALVDVFGARTVATQQNAGCPDVLDVVSVAGNCFIFGLASTNIRSEASARRVSIVSTSWWLSSFSKAPANFLQGFYIFRVN